MAAIVSPMPGIIVEILVKVGDAVQKETVVMYAEAMKMVNPIMADCEGVVKEIVVAIGDVVDVDQVLILLE